MTVEDVMTLLDISQRTAITYIAENRIPAYKVAQGKYLISKKLLLRKIEQNSDGFMENSGDISDMENDV